MSQVGNWKDDVPPTRVGFTLDNHLGRLIKLLACLITTLMSTTTLMTTTIITTDPVFIDFSPK